MKNKPLWKVALVTTPEAEDAVSELLQSVLNQPASSYTDVETLQTTVTSYLEKKPDWTKTRRALMQGLDRIKQCGLNCGAGKPSLKQVRREDWAESWKRHFKPIEIGSALLIKPSWSKRPVRKGQAVVILDPGLSFGTGQHPTTSFCLQQLAERCDSAQTFLDIGTGSGILAIAAAKLGYQSIEAFDFDPESVRVARENARKNRVPNKIHLYRADLTRLPKRSAKKYDVICANLISTLLIAERDRILARLKPDGVLIVAGILKSEFHEVEAAFAGAGFQLSASRSENEWRSGAFLRS
ncbi:MAG: 50S ribosomal protein L11 methyltransferase [Verrucomicrobiota bacterium]